MSLNNFQILNILGRGSFGYACLVKRKQDGKIYAMKRINLLDSPKHEIDAALNEVRLLASLNHINIIGYKEAFYDIPSNTLNIVMEFADGGDFSKKIEMQKRRLCLFNENIIWELIFQLLNGVVYLHNHHIMHRDLKPANIFLMKNGIIKIGDLNVSKLSKNNYARTQAGTPIYIAPEIWDQKPYDYKCDIWSLGCIIYELCTSFPPFIGNDINELYHNVKNGRYRPISNDYSNDLKQIIEWMLVINPNKRKSAKELLNSDIVQNRIKKNSRKDIIEKIANSFDNFDVLKTLKLPHNIKNINRILPHERYQMSENDPYEIMKKTIKSLEKKEGNSKKETNNINIQPLDINTQDMNNPKIQNNMNLNNKIININQNNNIIINNFNQIKIIKNEENENRAYYNIFKNNNKFISNSSNRQNNIKQINKNHINVNNINNNNYINNHNSRNNNSNHKISNKEINNINDNEVKNINNNKIRDLIDKGKNEKRQIFDQIKNEFKNNEIRKNGMNHYEQLKQKIIKNRLPSGQHKNLNNYNRNLKPNQNNNNLNYINNKNANQNYQDNRIIRNKKRSESSKTNNIYQIAPNNNFRDVYDNNNDIHRNYEIQNHNFNYNGKNFDMKPYKLGNKVKYGKINIKQYKENNREKFNKYLKNKKRSNKNI